MMKAIERRMPALAVLVMVGLALGGCASQVPVKPPAVSFGDHSPIALDVAVIDVVEQYRPPMAKPNVEHLAINPPGQAVRRWPPSACAPPAAAARLK